MARIVSLVLMLVLAGPAAYAACQEAPYDELDFLIGDWLVVDPEENILGESQIYPVAGGCALREDWSGVDGLQGEALFAPRADSEGWQMTWVDSDGLVLELEGQWTRGVLVFTGRQQDQDGEIMHRLVYDPIPELGQIQHVWEYSQDAGQTWQLFFDAWYAPDLSEG